MKQYLISLLLLFTLCGFGQVNRTVGQFNQVKIFDGISVSLIKSNQDRVIITGENAADVTVQNRNGKLKIRMKIDKIFSGRKTFIELYFSQDLDRIDLNENAFLSSDHVFTQTAIDLRAQEGAMMEVLLEVENLEAKVTSGGTIQTEGVCVNQEVSVNSGGQYYGEKLKTKQTKASVNAGGQARVNASEKVVASVKAGGAVKVYGNPKILDRKTLFGGRIEFAE